MRKFKILTFLLLLGGLSYGQTTRPNTNPSLPTTTPQALPRDTVLLTPIDSVNDTALVWAIIVDVKNPLAASTYQLITKSWVYANGQRKQADQWLEQNGNKVENWRKRLLWAVGYEDY